MLRPYPAVVAGLGADVVYGGNLHAVIPSVGTFHRQTVPDVDTDVAAPPHNFANPDVLEVCGHITANPNHPVGIDIRHAVAFIRCAAVLMRGVSCPSPQNCLYQAHAVKSESIGGRGADFGGSVRLLVVGQVVAVTLFV